MDLRRARLNTTPQSYTEMVRLTVGKTRCRTLVDNALSFGVVDKCRAHTWSDDRHVNQDMQPSLTGKEVSSHLSIASVRLAYLPVRDSCPDVSKSPRLFFAYERIIVFCRDNWLVSHEYHS